jgi:SAM-dependent methyltransferase
MRRDTCSSCGSTELEKFLDLGSTPIADAYTATADEVSKQYPLEVVVCCSCWLAQLAEVIDATTLFGTGYSFYSSASPPLSKYHHTYAEHILSDYLDLAKLGVVEVGCNDGDMLRWFRDAKCPTVGVDPAQGPVLAARDRGLNVVQSEFSRETAADLRTAGVIIANHVLAHVADVNEVLAGIKQLLNADGVAFVEVQYLPYLLVNNAFDLVYHEHRNFFSLTSLEAAVKRSGLVITDIHLTQRQGGSMRVTLRHEGKPTRGGERLLVQRDAEWWLRSEDGYAGVQGRVEHIRDRLWDILWDELRRSPDEVIAGYGAPAKATTLLNYCDVDVNMLDYVVDSTLAKQGRYIPGTGIPIVAPESVNDVTGWPHVFLLLAWNYAREIITLKQHRGLQWILPLPAPLVL